MYCNLFLPLCIAILFNGKPSATSVSRQTDDCTSGFMSLDRIEAAVQGGPESEDHVLGNVVLTTSFNNTQAILPQTNFTCDGSILSWTFGAQWQGNSQRYTELQIWRSSGDGSYTKVGSATIMLEEENSTRLYQYTLTSPLPFQAGDILGYFQGTAFASQLTLLVDVDSGLPPHYVVQDSPSSHFTIGNNTVIYDAYQLLIGVETNPAGCDCGFMSVERLHILLGEETVGSRIVTSQRQQIIPDIKFTCNGIITKWIFGATWKDNEVTRTRTTSICKYPELQVWRDIGNDTYYKISGTVMNSTSESQTRIYEYNNFSPIPVIAGDILGVFTPQTQGSKIQLWSEVSNGPIVYYVDTGSATESPVDAIDLQRMLSLSSSSYLPLVTVEIIYSPTGSVLLSTTGSPSPSNRAVEESFLPTPPLLIASLAIPTAAATKTIALLSASLSTSSPLLPSLTSSSTSLDLAQQNTGEEKAYINNASLFVGVGVVGTLLVLTTSVIMIITLLVCLWRRNNKVNITDNVAYLFRASNVKLFPNAAYNAVSGHCSTFDDQEYMYIDTASTNVSTTTSNEVQRATTSSTSVPDEPSTTPTSLTEIPTSPNEAYVMHTSTDGVQDIPTSTNVAYEITTSTNPSYVTDVPTSPNQAYEAVQYQSLNDTLTYDYIINQ